MNICKYIYNNKSSDLELMSAVEYKNQLIDLNHESAKYAFEKAWETRNFEIEMYWKRANYFWAFIASTFVGYFALVSSSNYSKADRFNHVEVYFLICIGFVLSCAWLFTNIGSKTWQRHWETHVDLLENSFTGPLYKTVNHTKTFSVSKINEIVSFMFVLIWLLLGLKYLFENNLVRWGCEITSINWFVVGSTAIAILAVFAMICGHGRGLFGERVVSMYRRKVYYQKEQ